MTTSKTKKLTRKNYGFIFCSLAILFFCAFLFLNIAYSQNISPLYFPFSNGEKMSSVLFLKDIRSLPQFNELLIRYEGVFEGSIKQLVFADEWQRKTEIEKLNHVLEKNSRARDVLYTLSTLYLEDGNELKAEELLKRAKEIDPNL